MTFKIIQKSRGLLRRSHGLTLIETAIAIAILAIAAMGIMAMLQRATMSSVAARNQVNCARALDSSFAQLKNMDFYAIAPVASSSTAFGLTSKFPYPTTSYTNIEAVVSNSNFSYYNINVTFMRRDTTDANNNGYYNDLIAFTPNPSNASCDLYDPNICYVNELNDNYYGTYISTTTGYRVSEVPDTHIKEVTVSIYKKTQQVCSRSEMISLEQYTGIMDPDSEASLTLAVDTPTNNSFIYVSTSTAQKNAQSYVILSTYPANVYQYRADSVSPILLAGEADPSDTIDVLVNTFSGSPTDTTSSNLSGYFSFSSSLVTSAIKEGGNVLHFRAVNGTFNSPWADRYVIYDINPPIVSTKTPTAASGPNSTSGLATFSPYVSATLKDLGITTTTTSGICPNVTSLFVNGSTVPYLWSDSSGTVVWVSTSGTVPIISSGTAYTMKIQFGDYAGYKASATWTFTLAVPTTDNSPPTITNESPTTSGAGTQPLIEAQVYDGASGINPNSILMQLDGVTVCAASIGNLDTCYSPSNGYVYYTPTTALSSGIHTVYVSVQHWIDNPAGDLSSNASWTFSP